MSSYLISPHELHKVLANKIDIKIFDCSYDLNDHSSGFSSYRQEHIPGAIYADLKNSLSASSENSASGGRHPLPIKEEFTHWLETTGMTNDTLVVVYDRNNAAFCVRLWWMLRWVGHANVRVLDGGLGAWKLMGYETESGESFEQQTGEFHLRATLAKLVDAEYILSRLSLDTHALIDARAPERYRGETESIDPFAGHIPGALNRPFSYNLNVDGTFKSPDVLRQEFEGLLQGKSLNDIICYCGSGVTAIPNILALELAGFGVVSLYGGSWSDWSRRADYPKEKSLERNSD